MNKNLSKAFLKRNAKFKAATKSERRVMVAKDVIAQLKKETILATKGSWVNISIPDKMDCGFFETTTSEKERDELEKEQICDLIGKGNVTCQACALGSMMLSLVRFRDKVTIEDYRNDYLSYDSLVSSRNPKEDMTGILSLFSQKQRILIEMAFEQGQGFYSEGNNPVEMTKERRRAILFGSNYNDNTNRLTAIMRNIVENNGKFIP